MNHLPMLGAVANGGNTSWDRAEQRHDRGFKRGDTKSNPGMKLGQRRELRRMEAAILAHEIALELAEPEAMPVDHAEAEAINAWGAFEIESLDDDFDDDRCFCSRCFLHDDFGGCLFAEDRHLAALATQADAAAEAFTAEIESLAFAGNANPTMANLPFDPDDLGWGFTIVTPR